MQRTHDELINELIESPDGDRWTLAATVVQQRATIAALTNLLRRVQFVTDTDLNKYCPICENEIWHGHTADCELAALLSPSAK